MDEFKANRGRSRLVNDRLYVQGKLQTQFQKGILPKTDKLPDIDVASVAVGTAITDSGSTFKGYAMPAANLEQVKECLNMILQIQEVSAANHVIYAYRLSGINKIIENFCSDDDHGMGMELLKMLRSRDAIDTISIVTRSCDPGFMNIGKKRFTHMCTTGGEALNML